LALHWSTSLYAKDGGNGINVFVGHEENPVVVEVIGAEQLDDKCDKGFEVLYDRAYVEHK